jgi:hypothetical protein
MMKTYNRPIQTEQDREMAARLVENRPIPFTLSITDGAPRSKAQNRLLHKWMGEIAEQKGDVTAEEVRAYCKLRIGVPILRNQNEAFRARYDEILRPLSYEQKIAIMSEPLNLPVTSLMSTKQLTEYMDTVMRHFGEQGIVLTIPDDMRNELNSNTGEVTPSDEPVSDAASPPSSAASTEAGDQPPQSPASTSLFGDEGDEPKATDEEITKLRRYAKDILNRAGDPNTSAQLMKTVEARWAEDIKPMSEPAKAIAGSIARSVRAIMKGEVDMSKAIEFHAEGLGCEPAELEADHG